MVGILVHETSTYLLSCDCRPYRQSNLKTAHLWQSRTLKSRIQLSSIGNHRHYLRNRWMRDESDRWQIYLFECRSGRDRKGSWWPTGAQVGLDRALAVLQLGGFLTGHVHLHHPKTTVHLSCCTKLYRCFSIFVTCSLHPWSGFSFQLCHSHLNYHKFFD